MVWISTPASVFDLPVSGHSTSQSHKSAAPHFKKNAERVAELEDRSAESARTLAPANGAEARVRPVTVGKMESDVDRAELPASCAVKKSGSTTIRPPVHDLRRQRKEPVNGFYHCAGNATSDHEQALAQPGPTVTRKSLSPTTWSSMTSLMQGHLRKPVKNKEKDVVPDYVPRPPRK